MTLYKISTAAKTVIGLTSARFGTCFTDITSDLQSYFYAGGYNTTGPKSGIAKISITGVTVFDVETSAIMYSFAFSQSLMELWATNTTTLYTLSLLTGGTLASAAYASGTAWAVVRNSSLGGADVYARATSNNFVQYNAGLTVVIAIATLVGNNINAGVGVNVQGQPTAVSGLNLRTLGVAGGLIRRVTPDGPVDINNGQVLSSGALTVASAVLLGDMFYTDGIQPIRYNGATDTAESILDGIYATVGRHVSEGFGWKLSKKRSRLARTALVVRPATRFGQLVRFPEKCLVRLPVRPRFP